MRFLTLALCLGLLAPLSRAAEMPAQMTINPDLSAQEILAKAHAAAGGPDWVRPKVLVMTGSYVGYGKDGKSFTFDDYAMHRVYPARKGDAHVADGKVRIEAKQDGETKFLIAFDGTDTYTQDGKIEGGADSDRWASNFGFGAIRHALDEGWVQKRLPDDLVDGTPAHLIELTDPSGKTTRFAIGADDYKVLYVGFDTPRGWHERRYSHFFTKDGVNWVQPGRVRLFYDGVKANEVIWTDFELRDSLPAELFVVE